MKSRRTTNRTKFFRTQIPGDKSVCLEGGERITESGVIAGGAREASDERSVLSPLLAEARARFARRALNTQYLCVKIFEIKKFK